ncbi:MAG: hypothetical protein ABFC86_09790 [Rectinema sp.]
MSIEKKKKRRPSAKNPCICDSPEDWEVERDLEAIARADAVRADPARMEKVKALAKRKLDESKRKKDEAQKMIELGTE